MEEELGNYFHYNSPLWRVLDKAHDTLQVEDISFTSQVSPAALEQLQNSRARSRLSQTALLRFRFS